MADTGDFTAVFEIAGKEMNAIIHAETCRISQPNGRHEPAHAGTSRSLR
jgi:hypothetical protein